MKQVDRLLIAAEKLRMGACELYVAIVEPSGAGWRSICHILDGGHDLRIEQADHKSQDEALCHVRELPGGTNAQVPIIIIDV